MWRCLVVVIGLGACHRHRAPIAPEDVGASGAEVSNPEMSAPVPVPAIAVDAGGVAAKCESRVALVPYREFWGQLPAGASADDLFNAALQFIATGPLRTESVDHIARTLITRRFDGQTIEMTCEINVYRLYALRMAVIGSRVLLAMDCWESFGWESHMSHGALVPADRGQLRDCGIAWTASRGDVDIPAQVFGGAVDTLKLRDITSPRP